MAIETVQDQLRQQQRSALALAKKHPAFIFSGAYFLLTGIGLLYSTLFFGLFGISFSDFAQPSDLLMAALKEPLLIALFLGSLLGIYLAYRLDFWMRRRFSWYEAMYRWSFYERLSYHPLFIASGVAAYAVAFTLFYVAEAAEDVRDGEAREVIVEIRGATETTTLRRTLLGTTSAFALVYDVATKEARAVPFESIVSLAVATERDSAATGSAEAAGASRPRPAPDSTAATSRAARKSL